LSEQSQSVLLSTDLGIADELRDKEFRNQFFRTERELDIPAQLKNLRKLRKLTQEELAEMVGTKQSAICRIERSQEANWELETLVKIAEALDARLSVVIEPYEAVIACYRSERVTAHSSAAGEPPKSAIQEPKTLSAAEDRLPVPAQRPLSIGERHGISRD
jgi:transcriptional regulator with XRE-family HTH domain